MAFIHGKHTAITVDGEDLSAFTNTSEFNATVDSHDVTTYGQTGHVKQGGLSDGTFTFGGIYDNTAATGPRAVLLPLSVAQMLPVPVLRQPEGLGSGLPQDSFSMLVTSYTETNPVADMVTWACEGEISGTVDSAPQAV